MQKLPPEEYEELIKKAFREASKEWLDKQFTIFGRWTFKGIVSLLIAFVGWFILHSGFVRLIK